MELIGVDLAWTQHGRTGLCHVRDGRVLASATVQTNDELVAWLGGRCRGEVIVALDAPLILRNETGRRRCEQLISRCFGAQHASTHSSNLRLPAFRDGVRGAWLAEALQLDVDPYLTPGAAVRRAVEVYPHTAIVALFDLPLTLKYKAKPGRDLASRSRELVRLVRLIEGLRDADPPLDVAGRRWERLAATAARPTRAADLASVEDEIDAHVCAYVALHYWTHGTTRCRVVGDLEDGYILTPVTARHAACLDALVAAAP